MVGETNYEKQKQFEYYRHLFSQTVLGKAVLAVPLCSKETGFAFDRQSRTNGSAGLSRGSDREAGEGRAGQGTNPNNGKSKGF